MMYRIVNNLVETPADQYLKNTGVSIFIYCVTLMTECYALTLMTECYAQGAWV